MQASESGIIATTGLHDSDMKIGFMDIQAEIHFQKSEYSEAIKIHREIIDMTAPNQLPYHHASSLATVAQMGIITATNPSEIISNMSAARQISETLQWAKGLAVCEELEGEFHLHRLETITAGVAHQENLKCYEVPVAAFLVFDCL
ncbi:hypothetical protein B0H10DRAFT_1940116 [Mycena sp. CBHHK59/15]|nr:hypothetical protein B0H10DRAFT_1940116 [Mycena sp. CBHHK59/15]